MERSEDQAAPRLALALPRVDGARAWLRALAALVGGEWSEVDERLALPPRRPDGAAPALPMLGRALDTELPLDELVRRFPAPEGGFRPGNEAYFRTVWLAHPWPGLAVALDLNSCETSALELTRLLVEGGRTWREARAAG